MTNRSTNSHMMFNIGDSKSATEPSNEPT